MKKRRTGFSMLVGGFGLALTALLITGSILQATVFTPPAAAQLSSYGFSPQAYKDGVNYGNGVYFAPYTFTLYSKPDEQSPEIGQFRWNQKTTANITLTTPGGNRRSLASDNVFFSFYPQLNVAMMPVIGENGEGWVEVIYDQAHQKTGWAHLKEDSQTTGTASASSLTPLNKEDTGNKDEPAHFGVYQTWPEFMKLNAKANGIYWLSGVKEYNRSIRTSDTDDAKIIPVTIIRHMTVKHLRGNWLLVEVLDFETNTPIGWLRWRDDDGHLMVFPNVNQQYRPIIVGVH